MPTKSRWFCNPYSTEFTWTKAGPLLIRCSSLLPYFQLWFEATRLVSSDNWRYGQPEVAPSRHSPSCEYTGCRFHTQHVHPRGTFVVASAHHSPPDEPDIHCRPTFSWVWVTACSLLRLPAPLTEQRPPELRLPEWWRSLWLPLPEGGTLCQGRGPPNTPSENDVAIRRPDLCPRTSHGQTPTLMKPLILPECGPPSQEPISYEGAGVPDSPSGAKPANRASTGLQKATL